MNTATIPAPRPAAPSVSRAKGLANALRLISGRIESDPASYPSALRELAGLLEQEPWRYPFTLNEVEQLIATMEELLS